jgi:hypothetical protein
MFERNYAYGKRDTIATSTGDWTKIPTGTGEVLDQKEGVVDGCFELAQAEVGDIILVATTKTFNEWSVEPEVETLTFQIGIVSAGLEPLVTVSVTLPDGTEIDNKRPAILRGAGRWTTYKNNPMVRGIEPKLAPAYGDIFVGGQMIFSAPETRDGTFWLIDSEISQIDIVPFSVDEEVV